MTMLVGFGQPNLNAILADTRVSWARADGALQGRNDALKTGLLFPGCVFGYTGDVAAARAFILSFKETIRPIQDDTATLWLRFQRFATAYPFPADRSFQLLLSQRAAGSPAFALLDSRRGLDTTEVPHPYFLLSYGSGTEPLVARVRDLFTPRLKTLQKALVTEQKQPLARVHVISPYLLCLWLSELSLTFEREWLHGHGVGGVFHFVVQGPTAEATQQPAVYVFSAADRANKTIRSWVYRVTAVAGGLYVEERIPPSATEQASISKIAFFDTAARYDLPMYREEEVEAMVQNELEAVGSSFFFCGFGFADPGDRVSFGFVASTEMKLEDVLAPDGKLTPWVTQRIIENFEAHHAT